MNVHNHLRISAQEFIAHLFKSYLEERDFALFISVLHKDITWFGSGKQEVCHNYNDAIALLEFERDSWDGKFKILNQWYESVPLGEYKFLVYGELSIVEDRSKSILLEAISRFSMICVYEDHVWKLFHAHFSLPNQEQEVDEFMYQKLVANYNELLESELEKRSKLLQAKTVELETLTNNICGGIQICAFDNGFTIQYISEGFTALTGYSQKDLELLFQCKHIGFVYEPDIEIVRSSILEQLESSNHFSVTYRIVHKDGHLIWVVDKGLLLPQTDGKPLVQSILTDITSQKNQESALLLSEKRYEIAMKLSETSMFEYNIQTKTLTLFENASKMYGLPSEVLNGVETFIRLGIIDPLSVPAYRGMYDKIHAGSPTAECYIKTKDKNGDFHDYQLILTTVFDYDGAPTRAIGVRKNISHILNLEKEQEFNKNLFSDQILIFEANITHNSIEFNSKFNGNHSHFPTSPSYTNAVDHFITYRVASEDQDSLRTYLSPAYIKECFLLKKNSLSFEYKQRSESGAYEWYRATINIIKDHLSDCISIRFYHTSIQDFKEKEKRALHEQRLYRSITAKAKLAYEVNITKNLAITGHENWQNLFDISTSHNYTHMLEAFSRKGAHPDDGLLFLEAFERTHVLDSFYNGIQQLSCEYRKRTLNNEFRWCHCFLHLYEDPETNDVKGFSYVEDIHEQKSAELLLKYNAEHDLMTNVYNKATTEQKIVGFLNSPQGIHGNHAFLIIDIDYFKHINDNFGHLFGDQVIQEIADKIHCNFRGLDIVGRIGGDEFCVFMKNVPFLSFVEAKASELCKQLRKNYTKDGKSCTISASIGISFYSDVETTYEDLYRRADELLYVAKKNGRNRYEL